MKRWITKTFGGIPIEYDSTLSPDLLKVEYNRDWAELSYKPLLAVKLIANPVFAMNLATPPFERP
jgi:hypothetical protein